jgi:pimeloyl-ACP methyl ester carboxylesterase
MHTLAGAGYHAVAIDLPPFGFSSRPTVQSYDAPSQARRILGVLDALHLAHVTLVGHSFSARATVEATFMAPARVDRLVLVDAALDIDPPASPEPAPRMTSAFLGNKAVRNAVVSLTLTNPMLTRTLLLKLISVPEAATQARIDMLQQPMSVRGTTAAYGAWLQPFLLSRDASLATQSSRYRTLTMPTLIIWGAQDAVTPLPQGKALASLIPGSELVVLPSAGHIPAIEAPAAFDSALLRFLGPTSRASVSKSAASPR